MSECELKVLLWTSFYFARIWIRLFIIMLQHFKSARFLNVFQSVCACVFPKNHAIPLADEWRESERSTPGGTKFVECSHTSKVYRGRDQRAGRHRHWLQQVNASQIMFLFLQWISWKLSTGVVGCCQCFYKSPTKRKLFRPKTRKETVYHLLSLYF